MTEVKAGRFAGPFVEIPFEYYIQSPVGLVPKDKGTKTRLIFHLSYPRTGGSVNAGIPDELCTVQYPQFDEAIKRCLQEGVNCRIAISDFCLAFRNVPLSKDSWNYLVLKAYHPVTGKLYYFADKCLPFGSGISCACFQEISNSIAYLVYFWTNKPVVNYLDDYLFIAALKIWCDWQVRNFMEICHTIRFPVSLEKTFWGTDRLIFLGMLIDTLHQVVCIPADKVVRARDMLEYYLNPSNKKTTVRKLQQLCGYLNFLCKCVVPGRAFTRRLYTHISPKLKPHHHININVEMRDDLRVWNGFVNNPTVFTRPFIDFTDWTGEDIDMYSDASGNWTAGGAGAYCEKHWLYQQWDPIFMRDNKPSIAFMELYAITAAVISWIHKFPNKRVYLFTDNKSARDMLNASSSSCKNCMSLIRMITVKGMLHNVRIFGKYVKSKTNSRADALSRLKIEYFKEISPPDIDEYPAVFPQQLWPIEKFWKN